MQNRFLVFLFLSVILYSCTRQPQLTREEVVAVIERFDNAWEHKNMNVVDSTLAKEYTYFTQSGGIFSRDSVVATAGESNYTLHDMSRAEIEISISGNTAIVSTRWKGKGTHRGAPFDEDQRCSVVVVKRNGRVEILSEHCTPIKTNRIFH